MIDTLIVLACVLGYLVVGALVGGYVYRASSKYDPVPDALLSGIFWPVIIIWWGFIKPISICGGLLADWQSQRTETRLRIAQEKKQRIATEMQEVDRILTEEKVFSREQSS